MNITDDFYTIENVTYIIEQFELASIIMIEKLIEKGLVQRETVFYNCRCKEKDVIIIQLQKELEIEFERNQEFLLEIQRLIEIIIYYR